MSSRILSALPWALACFVVAAPPDASAQEKFPSKTIEVVTHAGVGGGTDITARMMMVQAPAEFGQELVVVNKTGGSCAAALAYAASRPKDGHTILLITQTHLLTALQGPVNLSDPWGTETVGSTAVLPYGYSTDARQPDGAGLGRTDVVHRYEAARRGGGLRDVLRGGNVVGAEGGIGCGSQQRVRTSRRRAVRHDPGDRRDPGEESGVH